MSQNGDIRRDHGSVGTQTPTRPGPNPYVYGAVPYGSAPQTAHQTEQPVRGFQKVKPYLGGVVAVAVISSLAIGVKVYDDSKNSKRDGNGDISKQGHLSAMLIKPGDCFQKLTTTTSIASVSAVPCGRPHTAQVYGSYVYPDAPTRPSDQTIDGKAGPACEDRYRADVADAEVPADAVESFLVPGVTAWAQGRHDILCVLEYAAPEVGSILIKQP